MGALLDIFEDLAFGLLMCGILIFIVAVWWAVSGDE